MAVTLANLKTFIADWVADPNNTRVTPTILTQIINMTQRRLARRADLYYFEISDTFPTVGGTRSYALPANWARPHSLWYVDPQSNGVVFLKQRTKEQFDALFPVPQTQSLNTVQLPDSFTWWGGNLFLAPTPQQVVTVNRNYYQYLPDLVGDSDSNNLTNEAWDYLVFRSLVMLSKYLLEDPRIPVWMESSEELENDLISQGVGRRMAATRPQSQEPGFVAPTLPSD